ncbi:MAG: carboxypeptidase regulatory-like domain-containing protein, partial [Planctomycetes bacterium]|nr:carboxypeptidase regulatory-like domain-containing protein [Planctomycetota bacterium]
TRVRLYGRVVDVDETPASCLPVHITPLAADGEEPIPVARHAVYTDTAGRFEFRGLPPGRYRVAAAGHRSRVTIVDVDAPAQPTDDPVVLRLQPTKTICGTVRFADGKPAPGAQVHLNEPIPELGIVVTCSDHEGRFEVPCTGGRDAYDVFARFATLVGGRVASIASQRRVAPGRADVDLVLNF